MKKILMVCLGNICRSPIAEAVMIETLKKLGKDALYSVDSAGIGGWHVGDQPDHRSLQIMQNHGLSYSNRARQIKKEDFNEFDYILGMDEENMSDLRSRAPPNCKAEILLLGDFGLDKKDRIIEDPYYLEGDAAFEKCYQQCVVACAAFAKERLK